MTTKKPTRILRRKLTLLDELHLEILAPEDMTERERDRAARALSARVVKTRLRKLAADHLRKYAALKKCKYRLSR